MSIDLDGVFPAPVASEKTPFTERRIGSFQLSTACLRNSYETAVALLDGVVVVECRSNFSNKTLQYIGFHKDFDISPAGDVEPQYTCFLSREFSADGLHGVLTRKWHRVSP